MPTQYLFQVAAKVDGLKGRLDKQSRKALRDFQKSEARIGRKLTQLDSSRAKEFLAASKQQYNRLQQKLSGAPEYSSYLPALDTLKSSLKFLSQNPGQLKDLKQGNHQLSGALSKVKELEGSFSRAETIKTFIKERRQTLQEQFSGLPFTRELKKLHKQAYYYSAQLQEYKEILKDKKRLERKAIELLSQSKRFQEFMKQNSQLASLFRLPQSDGTMGTMPIQGLQTRAQINQSLMDRFGSGQDAAAALQLNMQAAKGQLDELKNKVGALEAGSWGNGDEGDLPDFKPNGQKTRSFTKRLEYGANLQSQKARNIFPVTTDIGLSLGYKLNDKSVAGVGVAYKMGLGSGFNDIKLTHQGLGLRSFLDYQLRGSFYISGGYELNFKSQIKSVAQLQDYSSWQKSGLVGLSKKYKISKKLKGSMQLLWDFLSYQQVLQAQPIVFRIGYSIK